MRRIEVQHNTGEQVLLYLRAALACMEEVEVPDDLRVTAFTEVYRSIASKQLILEQAAALPSLPGLRAPH